MGTAVIIFTIVFRILWLPVSIASGRSYKEQQAVAKRIKELEEEYKYDPVGYKQASKSVFRGNRRIVIASAVNILLQVMIALMLWRIFARGLAGEDFHLLYPFMPAITEPFNLTFMGKYDLSHPSLTLNLIQSLAIFVFEALNALVSVSIRGREVVMAQLVLPIVSFLIFATLPAGKKLFIITTLAFSIVQMIVQQLYFWLKSLGHRLDKFVNKTSDDAPEVTPAPPSPPEVQTPLPPPLPPQN